MDWRPCALLLGCAYQFPGKHTTHYNLWQWRGSDTCCNKNKFSQQQMFGFSRFSVIFCLLLEILIHSASIAMAPQISVTDWSQISSFPRSTPAPPRADPVTGREPWRGARRWDGEMMGNYALISRWFNDIAWQCMTYCPSQQRQTLGRFWGAHGISPYAWDESLSGRMSEIKVWEASCSDILRIFCPFSLLWLRNAVAFYQMRGFGSAAGCL